MKDAQPSGDAQPLGPHGNQPRRLFQPELYMEGQPDALSVADFHQLVPTVYYWTSTTNPADTNEAWSIFSCDFGVYDISKGQIGYTLAVR